MSFRERDEKQRVLAIARELIRRLDECEDEDFIDFVISCICDGDINSLSSDDYP